MSTEVVRNPTPEEEELARKLAELATLETELADRELFLATLLAELHAFERRYMRIVGIRYAELDDLRAQIAEARARQFPSEPGAAASAAEARARAEESARTADQMRQGTREAYREPTESLKKLFRTVAKAVHPDFADDDEDRARRDRFMAEANRAYEEGDEGSLEAILHRWESSPETVKGEGPGVELVRAIRKIAQIRARLDAIDKEVGSIKESPMHELKVEVEKAESDGRELLVEMAAAIEGEIAEAKEELTGIMDGMTQG